VVIEAVGEVPGGLTANDVRVRSEPAPRAVRPIALEDPPAFQFPAQVALGAADRLVQNLRRLCVRLERLALPDADLGEDAVHRLVELLHRLVLRVLVDQLERVRA
jgi:hypothetical protein